MPARLDARRRRARGEQRREAGAPAADRRRVQRRRALGRPPAEGLLDVQRALPARPVQQQRRKLPGLVGKREGQHAVREGFHHL